MNERIHSEYLKMIHLLLPSQMWRGKTSPWKSNSDDQAPRPPALHITCPEQASMTPFTALPNAFILSYNSFWGRCLSNHRFNKRRFCSAGFEEDRLQEHSPAFPAHLPHSNKGARPMPHLPATFLSAFSCHLVVSVPRPLTVISSSYQEAAGRRNH